MKFTRENIKKLDECSGVYYLQNMSNSRVYVGQSKQIQKRLINHFYLLNKKNHQCNKLQQDYNINSELFEFKIVEICEDNNFGERSFRKYLEWREAAFMDRTERLFSLYNFNCKTDEEIRQEKKKAYEIVNKPPKR